MLAASLLVTVPVFADDSIKVMFNGATLKLDVEPVVKEGRTLVPARAIFESLGWTMKWDSDKNQVVASKSEQEIVVNVGKTEATVVGKTVYVDVPPQIINGRVMVPLRFVAESTGATVKWNDVTRTVAVDGTGGTTASDVIPGPVPGIAANQGGKGWYSFAEDSNGNLICDPEANEATFTIKENEKFIIKSSKICEKGTSTLFNGDAWVVFCIRTVKPDDFGEDVYVLKVKKTIVNGTFDMVFNDGVNNLNLKPGKYGLWTQLNNTSSTDVEDGKYGKWTWIGHNGEYHNFQTLIIK